MEGVRGYTCSFGTQLVKKGIYSRMNKLMVLDVLHARSNNSASSLINLHSYIALSYFENKVEIGHYMTILPKYFESC